MNENKTPHDRLLLFIVLAVAAALRFWNFSGMEFMHDELSALMRAQAGSFSELISKAKTTDVHPVGIPIFVHYWSSVFGQSVLIMRLPFIICGLASIWYSYKIAEKWFNSTVAIITCAFLATLQFTTMYGQLERPYATGMLFSALIVWNWTNLFFGEPEKQMKSLVGFAIATTLCCYNHYFSLLFAVIVAGTGLFFLNKKTALKYLLACLAVVILFLPHISILLYHLSSGNGGGESWLGKPQPDWFSMFIKYLFHFSWIVYVLVVVLIFGSMYFRNKEFGLVYKKRAICLIWAFAGPAIAYYYSVHVTPVLQLSTMSFSVLFLLMFIFSFYTDLKTPLKALIVLVIVVINTTTLVGARKHYTVFYKQPYEQMAKLGSSVVAEYGEKNVSIALCSMDGFVDHYFVNGEKPFHYLRVDQPDFRGFLDYIQKEKTDYFVAGNLPEEYYQIILERYPYVIKKETGFTYTGYCFSKIKPATEIKEKVVFNEINNFEKTSVHWSKARNIMDDVHNGPPERPNHGHKVCVMDSLEEYGTTFNAPLYEITNGKHNIINVSADIYSADTSADPVLVIETFDRSGQLAWRGSDYKWFRINSVGANKVYVSQLLSGIDLKKHPYAEVKIYVWNRNKKKVVISNIHIEVIESNPLIYGLYEPLE